MWYEFPSDELLFALDAQFMLGPALLAAPVVTKSATHVDVAFPSSHRFYDADTGIEVIPTPGDSGKTQVAVDQSSIPRYDSDQWVTFSPCAGHFYRKCSHFYCV